MRYPKALQVSPDKLRANPWNTNFMSPENEDKLDAALTRFGLFKPIIVRELDNGDTLYEIIGGQHRWEGCVRLGFDPIDIMNLGPIDDNRAKEISLADNARYGADDTLSLAELLKELGTADEIKEYLPYTEADFASIFSSETIALDELDLDEDPSIPEEKHEPAAAKSAKTDTIMRFKVSIPDAEKIAKLIGKVQKNQGFSSSDDLTNSGDALVHLLLSKDEEIEE